MKRYENVVRPNLHECHHGHRGRGRAVKAAFTLWAVVLFILGMGLVLFVVFTLGAEAGNVPQIMSSSSVQSPTCCLGSAACPLEMMFFAMVMVKHRMKWLFLQPRICSFCHYHDHHGFKSTIFFLIKAAVEVINHFQDQHDHDPPSKGCSRRGLYPHDQHGQHGHDHTHPLPFHRGCC